MRAFLFTRNLHSSTVDPKNPYDLYYYEEGIMNPKTLLDFKEYGVHRRNFISRVLNDLSSYLGQQIKPLNLQNLSSFLQESGVTDLTISPQVGVHMEVVDHRVHVRNPPVYGNHKARTFKGFQDSVVDFGFHTVEPILPLEVQALTALRSYLGSMDSYAKDRGTLSPRGGMSLLSPYLALGVLRLQTLYHQVDLMGSHSEDLRQFKRQCLWALYTRYRFNQLNTWEIKPLEPSQEKKLRDWIQGTLDEKTKVQGFMNRYMKALKEGRPVSNRFRLITSYYLHFTLGIPWIYGQSYFRQVLVDYHPASNFMNWYFQCVRNRYTRFYNLHRQIGDYEPSPTA